MKQLMRLTRGMAVVACLLAALQPCHAAPQDGQPAKRPCSAPENRQFDFWVGNWNVEADGKAAGTNDVQLILGDCVVMENWSGVGGMNGKSFNVYNAARKQWQQTWVDSTGNSLELYGEFKDGAMRLVGEKQRGPNVTTLERITFTPMPDGRVRQLWDHSRDGGKTWIVLFDGIYVKKK